MVGKLSPKKSTDIISQMEHSVFFYLKKKAEWARGVVINIALVKVTPFSSPHGTR